MSVASVLPNNGVTTGALGNQPQATWGLYNNILFAVNQALRNVRTATLVRIDACSNDGDLSPVGTVDVTPLVNQVDGSGNPTPHVTVYGLSYLRVQGGSNALVMDPKVGDIGIAVFSDRDVSKVKATKAQANPGSNRTFDFADGLYLGGVLNATPTQYVQFTDAGVTIVSPNLVTIQAPSIAMDGDVTISGTLTATGDVTGAGISLQHHLHTSEAVGTPTSAPIP